MATYGFCPECGAPGVSRERRLNGDDICQAGHKYPSASAYGTLERYGAARETKQWAAGARALLLRAQAWGPAALVDDIREHLRKYKP